MNDIGAGITAAVIMILAMWKLMEFLHYAINKIIDQRKEREWNEKVKEFQSKYTYSYSIIKERTTLQKYCNHSNGYQPIKSQEGEPKPPPREE